MKKKTGIRTGRGKPFTISGSNVDLVVRNMELKLENSELHDKYNAAADEIQDLKWTIEGLKHRLKAAEADNPWLAPFAAGCFITFTSILIISLYFA